MIARNLPLRAGIVNVFFAGLCCGACGKLNATHRTRLWVLRVETLMEKITHIVNNVMKQRLALLALVAVAAIDTETFIALQEGTVREYSNGSGDECSICPQNATQPRLPPSPPGYPSPPTSANGSVIFATVAVLSVAFVLASVMIVTRFAMQMRVRRSQTAPKRNPPLTQRVGQASRPVMAVRVSRV